MTSKLNNKQEKFCQEYVKDLHLSNAYKRVYGDDKDPATLGACASKLLKNAKIQARISQIMREREKRTGITQDMVVKRLADIAFANIGMVCVWTDNGLELKETNELSEDELSIIQKVKVSPVSDGNGGLLGHQKEVQLKDSLKALELLGKHLGMLDGSGANKVNQASTTERLLSAVGRARERLTKRKDNVE